ncbi:UPF0758 domain-containing protein [Parapedobacter sp. DT-150]|uniref:UPF0758 domain-containing protein n=1 Tax=Parapedobacter sp. DT-150 TaxID=3396162 RepID=UPI003F1D1385
MANKSALTEAFPSASGKRHYFLDYMRAVNGSNYIRLTRSDAQEDGTYQRSSVVVFEEDFQFFIQAFSSLFHAAAYLDEGEVSVSNLKKAKQGFRLNPPDTGRLRPCERMELLGPTELSDTDLLATLIGSGNPWHSAVDIASLILGEAGHDLRKLGQADHKWFMRFTGMGLAKASAVMAAMELGKRMFWVNIIQGPLKVGFIES